MGDIGDGTSKTILYTESRERNIASWYCGSSAWVTALKTHTPDLVIVPKGVDGFPGPSIGDVAINYGPSDKKKPNDRWYTPKGTNAARAFSSDASLGRAWGPSSQHSGGNVIHVFADNHVKVISDGVAPHVYHHAATRRGNEPLNDADL